MTTDVELQQVARPKLPTEIIGYISEFCDFHTHTVVRSLCSAVRSYVPRPKVVCFEDFKKLVTLLNLDGEYKRDDDAKRRIFQERIHLDIHSKVLRMEHLKYLPKIDFALEACRIARVALDNSKDYKDINLLFDNCILVRTAAVTGNLDLLKRLLKCNMDPAGNDNRAIRFAAEYGHLAVIQALLQDSRVDPSARDNYAIGMASHNGHLAVAQALLQDPRVDPSANDNIAIRGASWYGHVDVVQALLQDPRVDPSSDDNSPIRFASQNGHLAIVLALLLDSRVDPSADDNYAIRLASENGHIAVVKCLLEDVRVDKNRIPGKR